MEADCLDVTRLLGMLDEDYGRSDDTARRRALQRDLQQLLKEERIAAVNPRGKPLRYQRSRCLEDDLTDDDLCWKDAIGHIQALATDVARQRQLDRLWQRLLTNADGLALDAKRVRVLPDTLRLQSAVIDPRVLTAVIAALAKGCALDVVYENVRGDSARVRIHPQAVVQRGPIPYLFALKNDEDAPVRLYALHRMSAPTALTQVPARQAEGFDLDQAIAKGIADFGPGKMIELELRVGGYLTDVIENCRLSPDQEEEKEPDDSAFDIRIRARVPSTGQLLRWILGAGDNVEVLAPPDLRQTVAAQAVKMAGLYQVV